MQDSEEGVRAFSTFRVLNGDANLVERDQLFRNMAQLFSYVSDRCDDEQVAQYDEVLCQLAELVEVEARSHVARLLAPLDRAPGMVVVKLANDEIEVAQPLLEFSNVLSDDDLIDIISARSEAHREVIAGRDGVTERVGEAIVEHGGAASVGRLVRNDKAVISARALEGLVRRAHDDPDMAADLRGRADLDWNALRDQIDVASSRVLETLGQASDRVDPVTAGKVNAVVYNRMRNRAGFSANEWKVAYNQVKALSDRRQLDEKALLRFARFGYGGGPYPRHRTRAVRGARRLPPLARPADRRGQDQCPAPLRGAGAGRGHRNFRALAGACLPPALRRGGSSRCRRRLTAPSGGRSLGRASARPFLLPRTALHARRHSRERGNPSLFRKRRAQEEMDSLSSRE
jgi:hypothetical protein